MKSYLKTLAFGASLLSASAMMAQPGGGFPGGGFGGFGGDQSSQAKAEFSEKFTDINYAGDDGQVYHMLDIYLPKEVKAKYPGCGAHLWKCMGK